MHAVGSDRQKQTIGQGKFSQLYSLLQKILNNHTLRQGFLDFNKYPSQRHTCNDLHTVSDHPYQRFSVSGLSVLACEDTIWDTVHKRRTTVLTIEVPYKALSGNVVSIKLNLLTLKHGNSCELTTETCSHGQAMDLRD